MLSLGTAHYGLNKFHTKKNLKKKKNPSPFLLFFEDMKAAAGVATHEDVPGGMQDVDGADGAQAVGVAEGVQQRPGVAEELDLPRPHHAAHREALLLLGVPHRAEPCQPAARVAVVAAENKRRETK